MEENDKKEGQSQNSDDRYRMLFHNIPNAFAYCQIIYDDNDEPVDFSYLEVNDAFKKLANYSDQEIVGKKVSEVFSDYRFFQKDIFDIYSQVASTQQEVSFEYYFERVDKWLEISVYSPQKGYFVTLIQDVTSSKKSEKKLEDSNKKTKELFDQTVDVLASTIAMRDPFTAGHQKNVAKLACAIAAEMGLDEDKISGLRIAALLHDIGKMAVPSAILNKPHELTDLELELARTHAKVGYDILKKIEFPWPVAEIVYQHHERLDGSGYPQGLTEDDILLEAKILAVADVVEAFSFPRSYRPAQGIEVAIEEISRNKGWIFDEDVVDACLEIIQKKDSNWNSRLIFDQL